MKKIISYIAVILFITGCYSNRIIISDYQNEAEPDTLHYSTYWTAMRCGFPNLADNYTDESDKLKFAEGLAMALDGNYLSSEMIFKDLINSSKNDTIVENSKLLFKQVLIYQSKWKDFLDNYRNSEESDSKAISRLLYPAFINSNEETIYNKDSDTIPLKIRKGLVFVPVNINGIAYEFLFDTGTQFTTISSEIKEQLGIRSLSKHSSALIGSTGKRSDIETAIMDNFKFGNFIINNKPCLITDEDNLKFKFWFYTFLSFEGILAWDIIKNLDVEIDMKNEIMILRKPKINNVTERNLLWLDSPIVKLQTHSGIDLLFILDTGAQESNFYDFLLAKMKAVDMKDESDRIYGLGGHSKRNVKLMSNVSFRLGDNLINFSELKSGQETEGHFIKLDGVLGIDIGRNSKIRIDGSNGVFEIIGEQ